MHIKFGISDALSQEKCRGPKSRAAISRSVQANSFVAYQESGVVL